MFIRTVLASLAAALALAAPAAAQSAPFDDCPAYGDQRICTAQVPSFDDAARRRPDAAGRRREQAPADRVPARVR
jgi:hypothetical protein